MRKAMGRVTSHALEENRDRKILLYGACAQWIIGKEWRIEELMGVRLTLYYTQKV